LSQLGVVGGAAAWNATKNVSVRDRLVARPLDNAFVNISVTLKLEPFPSNPESHAQILSDRCDGLKIAFEEPPVVRIHCVQSLADLTQAAGRAYAQDLKRILEMVPRKGTADQT
jgi:hypothetical protein